jgi:hypothetical protein
MASKSKIPSVGALKRPTASKENLPSRLPRFGAPKTLGTTYAGQNSTSGIPRFGMPKTLPTSYSGGLSRSANLEFNEKDLDDNKIYTPAEGHVCVVCYVPAIVLLI